MTSRRTLLMAFKLQFACEKLVGWVNCFLNWKFSVRSEWEMELFFCSSPLHQLPFNRKSPHYAMLMMMSSSVTWEMQKVSPWWRIDRMLTVNGPQRINWGLREGISQVDLFTTDDDGKKNAKTFPIIVDTADSSWRHKPVQKSDKRRTKTSNLGRVILLRLAGDEKNSENFHSLSDKT